MNPSLLRSLPAIVALSASNYAALSPSLSLAATVAHQAVGTATIAGTLVSQTGLPVGGATVILYQGSVEIGRTISSPDGRYSLTSEPPGDYTLDIKATGYETTRVEDVVATSGATTAVRTVVPIATTYLQQIGYVSTNAGGSSLASSATIQHILNPAQLRAQGYANAAQALGNVPGINLSGSQHSAGDDTFIDIRGMGEGEVRPLVDGHPVGPIGVFSTDYYNYTNSPYDLLQDVQTTVGSGAAGLYGVDVIGGTIDFRTLEPTNTPQAELTQGYGDNGFGLSVLKSTGKIGRLGYAVGHMVQGSFNDFQPQDIFQSARPNNNANLQNGGACLPGSANNPNGYPDITTCNQVLNTYPVSGNYRIQNDLGKLRYNFADNTSLTLAAYASNQLSDSTGNGDNDNVPYQTRLAQIDNATPQCSTSGAGADNGYYAITDSNSTGACLTAAQLASASSGPDGGGQDRNRGTSLQDYHARFNTVVGKNNAFTADVFRSYYDFRKNSVQAAGLDPTGTFYTGSAYLDQYLTNGVLLSDDIASARNDFGAGYFVEHQHVYGSNLDYDAGDNTMVFTQQPQFGEADYSFFVRDEYDASDRFSAFLNAWDRRQNVTAHTTFDPRLSLVFKPTNRDIVRLTGGRADGDPAPEIKSASDVSSVNNPSSLNPTCNAALLNSVATVGNSNLESESANDVEAGYGHRFWSDTSVNLVGYVSGERNALYDAVVPISQSGPTVLNNPLIASQLAGFAQKISSSCPNLGALDSTSVLQYLGVTQYDNAASALYRGVELTGRIRLASTFYIDYAYNIQSAEDTGISSSILGTNPTLLNNAQIYEIPLHKGSLTFDYQDGDGIEAQIEGLYVGPNNDLNRPAYGFFNGFVSKAIGKYFSATLGANNMFNQDVQYYGYFGQQLTAPVNQYAPAPSAAIAGFPSNVQQAVTLGLGSSFEEIGLPPRQINFTLDAKI